MANTSAGAEIGDDALREIFARLPGLRDLLCCAASCKRWRRLITDLDFIRRVGFWPDTARRPCILAGIFFQNYYSHGNRRTNDTVYAPPRFLGLQAGLDVHRSAFDSFVTIDDGHDKRLFDAARPLAARRGFLLVHIQPPSSSLVLMPSSSLGQKLHLAVCRPLLDKMSTQLLPLPPGLFLNSTLTLEGYAIITAADHPAGGDGSSLDFKRRHQQPMFQVFLIYNDNGDLYTRTYSSDAPDGWSAPVKCCLPGLTRCGPRAGVVAHGMVHWLFKADTTNLVYTLNLNIAKPCFSLTPVPIKFDAASTRPLIPCVAGEEGRFSFITIQDKGAVNLWTNEKQDDDGHVCVWQTSQLTELGSVKIDMVFFAESRGALLVEQGGAFSIVDLKGKEKMPLSLKDERTERVRGTRWFRPYLCSSTCCRGHFGSTCVNTTPVLYEIDWAFSSIFSSQA